MNTSRSSCLLVAALLFCGTCARRGTRHLTDARAAFAAIQAHPQVRQGLDFLKADDANTLAEHKALVVIPAPPFKESAR